MATEEERRTAAEGDSEIQDSLGQAEQMGQSKGTGITPGHAGEATAGDAPAEGGQTPTA